jgi:hypothetical protein
VMPSLSLSLTVVHVVRDAFFLRQCYNLRFPCEDKEVRKGVSKADCQISARQFYGAQPWRTLNCRYPYKALTIHHISQPILLDHFTSGQQDPVKRSQRPLKPTSTLVRPRLWSRVLRWWKAGAYCLQGGGNRLPS